VIKVFISYSHRDENLKKELDKHLSALKRQGIVDVWHDRRIVAGDEFAKSIDAHLNEADIILLLISADFMDSRYCWSIEMARAMERHAQQSARVIPVILRACDWHLDPIGKLTAAPTDGMAIMSWKNTDEAFTDVARHVRAAVELMTGGHGPPPPDDRPRQSFAYCKHCGATPGKQSICTGSRTAHEFVETQLPKVFCSRCGVSAGAQSICTGSRTHHDFVQSRKAMTYCSHCGAQSGTQSICTGSRTHHEFR
jgi:hypothetical protein